MTDSSTPDPSEIPDFDLGVHAYGATDRSEEANRDREAARQAVRKAHLACPDCKPYRFCAAKIQARRDIAR